MQTENSIRWFKICIYIAILSALTSTLFLHSLNYVTSLRLENKNLVYGLPLAGLLIIYLYKKFGGLATKGNNLLLQEYYHPQGKIPLILAPLIIFTTLLTHLFGGSAGREGTAVQYGGTYGDFIAKKIKLNKTDTRIALLCGVSAGFASLFGTPLAGALFAIELFKIGKTKKEGFIQIFLTAYLAHFICLLLKAPHTIYPHLASFEFLSLNSLWLILAAIIFGLTSRLFILSGNFFKKIFEPIKNEYLRIAIGGLIIVVLSYFYNITDYQGLGLPIIQEAFHTTADGKAFLLKIILTTLTLSVGFKGGEVTPLFFIGATLGSFLSLFLPVPLLLLASIGFVSVFAGCTKTPIACAVMAAELFGFPILPIALPCTFLAYYISGKTSIYSSQRNIKLWL